MKDHNQSAMPQSPPEDSASMPAEERAALAEAIDGQRSQLWRAHAITLTAAKLLHETYDFEQGEPDIAYALDAAAQIVEDTIDRLDPTNLKLTGLDSPMGINVGRRPRSYGSL